jgi:precorrin-8X/cobalt-precorrin-8 methylmutase
MFMGASTQQGEEIAIKSRKIVKSLIKDKISGFNLLEIDIMERIVHSTADIDYADLVRFSNNFTDIALKSLRANEDILTDITMVKSGITQYNGNVECFIKNKDVIAISKENQITRAAASVEFASQNDFEGVIVIGNAPTALFKAIELFNEGKLNVKAIIGVPVGFVAASESKEELSKSKIPYIITNGPKGGTPVAVAAINSLISKI